MTNNRIWTIGAVVLIIAILVAGWFLGVVPRLADADTAAAQQSQVDARNAAAQANLAKLKGQYSNLAELSAKLAKLQLSIPGAPNVDTFVNQLDNDAAATGVGITGITVSPATAFAAPAAPAAPTPASTATATPTPTPTVAAPAGPTVPVAVPGQLYTLELILNVKGDNSQIFAFTRDVQHGNRLFLISGLTLTASVSSTVSSTGSLTGYLFVVQDLAGLPTIAAANPTVLPTPTLAPTSPPPTSTPTSSSTPAP